MRAWNSLSERRLSELVPTVIHELNSGKGLRELWARLVFYSVFIYVKVRCHLFHSVFICVRMRCYLFYSVFICVNVSCHGLYFYLTVLLCTDRAR